MLRKILSVLCVFTLLLTLVACGPAPVEKPAAKGETVKPQPEPAVEKLPTLEYDYSGWYPTDDSDYAMRLTIAKVISQIYCGYKYRQSMESAALYCTGPIAAIPDPSEHPVGAAVESYDTENFYNVWYAEDVAETYRFLFGEDTVYVQDDSRDVVRTESPALLLANKHLLNLPCMTVVTDLQIDSDRLTVEFVTNIYSLIGAEEYTYESLLDAYLADPETISNGYDYMEYPRGRCVFTYADDGHLVVSEITMQ